MGEIIYFQRCNAPNGPNISYFFCYLATNEKIAITHLWHAMGPKTMYHLIAKDKVAEQHI